MFKFILSSFLILLTYCENTNRTSSTAANIDYCARILEKDSTVSILTSSVDNKTYCVDSG